MEFAKKKKKRKTKIHNRPILLKSTETLFMAALILKPNEIKIIMKIENLKLLRCTQIVSKKHKLKTKNAFTQNTIIFIVYIFGK